MTDGPPAAIMAAGAIAASCKAAQALFARLDCSQCPV
jgi:hypothetical protein